MIEEGLQRSRPPSAAPTSVLGFPPAVWLVCAGAFVNRFGSFVQVFLVIYLHQERGYSAAESGAAVAFYGLGSLSSAAVGGVLADRIGDRRAIATSMFLTAGTLAAIPSVSAGWLLVPLLGLAGFATDLYRPATAALLGALTPRGRRLPVFGLYRLSIGLGYTIGLVVAGFVARSSFRLVFLVDAATSLVFGALALTALHDRRASTVGGKSPKLLPRLRADPPFLLLLLASGLVSVVFFQNGSTLPLHIRDSGHSLVEFGTLMSIGGLTVTALALPVSRIAQRLSTSTALTVGAALVGGGFALTGLASSYAALAVCVFAWGLGELLWSPVAQARAADLAPAGFEARYQGALGLIWASGLSLSPLIGTALYGWHPETVWLTGGVLAALAVVAIQSTSFHAHEAISPR
jgi:MFS family permease